MDSRKYIAIGGLVLLLLAQLYPLAHQLEHRLAESDHVVHGHASDHARHADHHGDSLHDEHERQRAGEQTVVMAAHVADHECPLCLIMPVKRWVAASPQHFGLQIHSNKRVVAYHETYSHVATIALPHARGPPPQHS